MTRRLLGIAVLAAALLAACGREHPGGHPASDDRLTAAEEHRIDRVGRIEVSNFLVGIPKGHYNQEDTFDVPPAHLAHYRELLAANLEAYDRMDGAVDWTPDGGEHPLAEPFLRDFLIVDLSKPCAIDDPTYLEIEKAALRGEEHSTCGGRVPNDDTLDTLLTLLVNGPERDRPRRSDGVDRPARPATASFPYLVAPD